jgi:hypothetical protein
MAFPTALDPVFSWGSAEVAFKDLVVEQPEIWAGPAIVMAAITPDATGLVPLVNPKTGITSPTRWLIANAVGTVTGHDAFGNVVTALPLQAGINKISLAGVTSIATTTSLWGVW